MNDITKREFIALQILNGACAADWKFDIPEGMSWGQIASLRAFQIADDFLDVVDKKITFVEKKAEPEAKPKPKAKPKATTTKK